MLNLSKQDKSVHKKIVRFYLACLKLKYDEIRRVLCVGNKEQFEPAENTCIKATFDLFAVALRK